MMVMLIQVLFQFQRYFVLLNQHMYFHKLLMFDFDYHMLILNLQLLREPFRQKLILLLMMDL